MENKTDIQNMMRERATLEKCLQMINGQLEKLWAVVSDTLSEFEIGQDVKDSQDVKWKIVKISTVDAFYPIELMGSSDVRYTGNLLDANGRVMKKELPMEKWPFTPVSGTKKTSEPDKGLLKACAEEMAEWTKLYHDCQVDLDKVKEELHALTELPKA